MSEDFLGAARWAAELTARYLVAVPAGPVWRPVDDQARAWLTDQPLPAHGRPLPALLADLEAHVLPYPMGNGHPRFFGWVNSPPSPAGVLVETLAAAMNPSCAGGEHAGVLLERGVVRWLAELLGYPHRPGGGLLTSGASMATIICLAAARNRAARALGWDVRVEGTAGGPPLVLYLSQEGHGCIRKAAELLGIGVRGVRVVPVDSQFRMDPGALRAAVAHDRTRGLLPFCVAASAGTVNTGAVDPLAELVAIAAEGDLWLHVDGAYGALGVLDPQAEPRFAGMARADSLALDPHKWLGVPIDCGAVLVRDPEQLRDTFSHVPAYLRDDHADDAGWYSEYGIEQTRPFRALRTWAAIAHRGRAGITALVRHTTELAHTLASRIDHADDLERLAPVHTSIVAFRYCSARLSPDELDALNRSIPTAVARRGRAFLTGTRLAGCEALRACLIHPDTTEDDLTTLLDEIRATANEMSR